MQPRTTRKAKVEWNLGRARLPGLLCAVCPPLSLPTPLYPESHDECRKESTGLYASRVYKHSSLPPENMGLGHLPLEPQAPVTIRKPPCSQRPRAYTPSTEQTSLPSFLLVFQWSHSPRSFSTVHNSLLYGVLFLSLCHLSAPLAYSIAHSPNCLLQDTDAGLSEP